MGRVGGGGGGGGRCSSSAQVFLFRFSTNKAFSVTLIAYHQYSYCCMIWKKELFLIGDQRVFLFLTLHVYVVGFLSVVVGFYPIVCRITFFPVVRVASICTTTFSVSFLVYKPRQASSTDLQCRPRPPPQFSVIGYIQLRRPNGSSTDAAYTDTDVYWPQYKNNVQARSTAANIR